MLIFLHEIGVALQEEWQQILRAEIRHMFSMPDKCGAFGAHKEVTPAISLTPYQSCVLGKIMKYKGSFIFDSAYIISNNDRETLVL